jgi:hypothetical protein
MYYSPSTVNSQLASFPDGTEFEEIIKKRSNKTTMSQHAYYRGVILEACYQSEMGSQFDKADDIHEDYFAPKFLSYKKLVTDPRGVKSEITKYISMAEMSIEETSEFIEKVIADCAMNGIYFRSPEEYYNSLYK